MCCTFVILYLINGLEQLDKAKLSFVT